MCCLKIQYVMRRWKTPFLLSPGAFSTTPDYLHKQTLSFSNEKTNKQNEKRIIHIAALHAKPVFFVFLIVRHDLSLVLARSRAKL